MSTQAPSGFPRSGPGGRGLFLDRDGTLIYDRHYLSDPAGVEVIPGVPEALRLALDAGFRLYLFSNQSGVGRGYFTLRDVEAVNARMLEEIGLGPALFSGVCLATERPDEPAVYRKPSPRFILETIERDGLDRSRCWMVGDSPADFLAGRAAGVRDALVATGRAGDPRLFVEVQQESPPIYRDLLAFVRAELAP